MAEGRTIVDFGRQAAREPVREIPWLNEWQTLAAEYAWMRQRIEERLYAQFFAQNTVQERETEAAAIEQRQQQAGAAYRNRVARVRRIFGTLAGSDRPGRARLTPKMIEVATGRARPLLLRLLTSEQREQFDRAGCFLEKRDGWRIMLRLGEMIHTSRDGQAEYWCIQPDPWADENDWLCPEDVLIGQLLHLRAAGPDALRRIANVYPADLVQRAASPYHNRAAAAVGESRRNMTRPSDLAEMNKGNFRWR